MLSERQLNVMFSKLRRFESTLERLMFEKVGEVEVQKYETMDKLFEMPDASLFTNLKRGDMWGQEYGYCWLKGEFETPEDLDGKTLFVYPRTNAYEILLFVDDKPFGIFCSKILIAGHGNHYCGLIKKDAKKSEIIKIGLECYAGHHIKGCAPFEETGLKTFNCTYESIDICVKNEMIADVLFDLKTLNQAVTSLDLKSFRRADIINTLTEIHQLVYYDYDNADKEAFTASLKEISLLMKKAIEKTNSVSAPYVGLIGHSHMDTAWLWSLDETIKKCARTYSNQMSLMEQYPEYNFVQSSAYHGQMIREHYPQLFEMIQKRVAEGRYEPNGAVWVECDCNITSGESMVRQFVWGQNFTRKYFNYTSDAFWLPDTFGYSASIPQIMKGCGVKYFLTTKLAWNDTTHFPYDTFYWRGLDGTKVLTHFNKTHTWPDAENLMEYVYGARQNNVIKEKTVSNMRLVSYGFGDGGGGPQFEMIEMSRRVKNFEGIPKSEHTTVSKFMEKLEASVKNPSTYNGELYLELHRGTLTNQHNIKRNNRLAEIAIHDLEYLAVNSALEKSEIASDKKIRPLLNTLLVNQFHDILPGTCINIVHERSIAETGGVIKSAKKLINDIANEESENSISVINTLSFDRDDVLYIDYKDGLIIDDGYNQQSFTDLHGNKKLAIGGLKIGAFNSAQLKLVKGEASNADSPFTVDSDLIATPFAKLIFNEKGFIKSFTDIKNNRELKGEGYALNTFLMAEDVPNAWDNWDIDADIEFKFKDDSKLIKREVISNGPVELRVRSEYEISSKSKIFQDMIFYAHSPEVRFETLIDWEEEHRLLKAAFDTTVFSDFARHETQFGFVKRPTNRSTNEEKAKFEVCNHKYTDLSEAKYGVAILNDCKYGISVKESQMRLTLHKGGVRPDYSGDKGLHDCTYSFYPHDGGFSVETAIKPAYMLNYKPVIASGSKIVNPLISIGEANIIAETIKPCEDNQKAFIVRMYDSEGAYTNTQVKLSGKIKKAELTNMLEETLQHLEISGETLEINFKPFEIKTLKLYY